MAMVINCPGCKIAMQLGDDAAGKQFRCPRCQTTFTVGAAPAPARPAAPPPTAAPAPTPAPAATTQRPAAPTPATPPAMAASRPAASACPACGSALLPGAISCMDCGYLLQGAPSSAESDVQPCICPNPACGVANPPGERNCQRCSTPLPTASGTMIAGRYRIEKLLAMGGFGAVYLATDTKDQDKKMVLKEMICGDPQEFQIRLNFFRREAETLRMLEIFPVVPRFTELVEQGQMAYLVMEFIRGQDLLKMMEGNNNQPFSAEQAIAWGQQICDVLDYMHSQTPPLVHRDLKPDNIMLLEDQKTIKMIDFGTARDLGRTAKEKNAAKTRVYTEGYAPPEQIVGKPEPRSDLFLLAGTLYHLVTGKPPEGFHTARELEEALSSNSPALPANYRWLFDLIRINLAEDVNERYFSAKEFKQDLIKRQVTTQTLCPKCQQANKVREPYCTKCAEPLTQETPPCYHCGKTNRMGSRCCIHCGNRLR